MTALLQTSNLSWAKKAKALQAIGVSSGAMSTSLRALGASEAEAAVATAGLTTAGVSLSTVLLGVAAAAAVAYGAYKIYDNVTYHWADGLVDVADNAKTASNNLEELRGYSAKVKELNLVISSPESTQEEIASAKQQLEEIAALLNEKYSINVDTSNLDSAIENLERIERNNLINQTSEYSQSLTSNLSSYNKNQEIITEENKKINGYLDEQRKLSPIKEQIDQYARIRDDNILKLDNKLASKNIDKSEHKKLVAAERKTYYDNIDTLREQLLGIIGGTGIDSYTGTEIQTDSLLTMELNTIDRALADLTDPESSLKKSEAAVESFDNSTKSMIDSVALALSRDIKSQDYQNIESDINRLELWGHEFVNAGYEPSYLVQQTALAKQGFTDASQLEQVGGEAWTNTANDYIAFAQAIGANTPNIIGQAALLKNGFTSLSQVIQTGGLACTNTANDYVALAQTLGANSSVILGNAALIKNGFTDFSQAVERGGEACTNTANDYFMFGQTIGANSQVISTNAALMKNGFSDISQMVTTGGEAINNVANDYVDYANKMGLSANQIASQSTLIRNGFSSLEGAAGASSEVLEKMGSQATQAFHDMGGDANVSIKYQLNESGVLETLQELTNGDYTVSVNATGDVSILNQASNELKELNNAGVASISVNANGDISLLNEAAEEVGILHSDGSISVNMDVSGAAELQAAIDNKGAVEGTNTSTTIISTPGLENLQAAVSAQGSLCDKTVTYTIITNKVTNETSSSVPASSPAPSPSGGGSVNGTAHAYGTAKANGNWGNKTPGKTLVGELGSELVVDPNTAQWHTVGDNGAEFVDLPKNAIVFNHKQTEALLSNGYVAGRGKALVSGNALFRGVDPYGYLSRGSSALSSFASGESTIRKEETEEIKDNTKSESRNTAATDDNTQAKKENTKADEESSEQEEEEEKQKEIAIAMMQHRVDTAKHYLEQFSAALQRIDEFMEIIFDGDYIKKMDMVKEQIDIATEYSEALQSTLDDLLATNFTYAEEGQILADAIKEISDEFFENQRELVKLQNELFEYRANALTEMVHLLSGQLQTLNNTLQEINDALLHGSVIGGLFQNRMSPSITYAAIEKERQVADELREVEEEYYQKWWDMEQRVIDLTLQEKLAEINKKADGGLTSGMTLVNENGRESYIGSDRKLHWFKNGAQLFNTNDVVRVLSAEDTADIVKYTGYKYFNTPIGGLNSVTSVSSGSVFKNSSGSFRLYDVNKLAAGNTPLAMASIESIDTDETKDTVKSIDEMAEEIAANTGRSLTYSKATAYTIKRINEEYTKNNAQVDSDSASSYFKNIGTGYPIPNMEDIYHAIDPNTTDPRERTWYNVLKKMYGEWTPEPEEEVVVTLSDNLVDKLNSYLDSDYSKEKLEYGTDRYTDEQAKLMISILEKEEDLYHFAVSDFDKILEKAEKITNLDGWMADQYENIIENLNVELNNNLNKLESDYNTYQKSWSEGFITMLKSMTNEAPFDDYMEYIHDAYITTMGFAIDNVNYQLDDIRKKTDEAQKNLEAAWIAYYQADTATRQNYLIGAIEEINQQLQDWQSTYNELIEQAITYSTEILTNSDEKFTNAIGFLEKSFNKLSDKLDKLEIGSEYNKTATQGIRNLESQRSQAIARRDNAHESAERIREIILADPTLKYITDRFKLEEVFDSNGDFNYLYDEMRTAMSMAVERGDKWGDQIASEELVGQYEMIANAISVCKKAFYEASDAVDELTNQIFDLELDKAQNKIDLFTGWLDGMNKIDQWRVDRGSALQEALSSVNSVKQTIREAINDAVAEVRANRDLEQWLDPQTRKLLFNDEDLSEYTDKMNLINKRIQSLYDNYENDINNLSIDEQYKKDEITNAFNRELEVQQELLETAKDDLNIAKKSLEYQQAAQERDTQIIMGNRVVNVADPQKLHDIALELEDVKSQKDEHEYEYENNDYVRAMEESTDAISKEIEKREYLISEIDKMPDEIRTAWAKSLPDAETLQMQYDSVNGVNIPELNRFLASDVFEQFSKALNESDISEGFSAEHDQMAQALLIQKRVDEGYYDSETGEKLYQIFVGRHYSKASSLIDFKQWYDELAEREGYAENFGSILRNYEAFHPEWSKEFDKGLEMFMNNSIYAPPDGFAVDTGNTVVSGNGSILLQSPEDIVFIPTKDITWYLDSVEDEIKKYNTAKEKAEQIAGKYFENMSTNIGGTYITGLGSVINNSTPSQYIPIDKYEMNSLIGDYGAVVDKIANMILSQENYLTSKDSEFVQVPQNSSSTTNNTTINISDVTVQTPETDAVGIVNDILDIAGTQYQITNNIK